MSQNKFNGLEVWFVSGGHKVFSLDDSVRSPYLVKSAKQQMDCVGSRFTLQTKTGPITLCLANIEMYRDVVLSQSGRLKSPLHEVDMANPLNDDDSYEDPLR